MTDLVFLGITTVLTALRDVVPLELFVTVEVDAFLSRAVVLLLRETASALEMQIMKVIIKYRIFFIS